MWEACGLVRVDTQLLTVEDAELDVLDLVVVEVVVAGIEGLVLDKLELVIEVFEVEVTATLKVVVATRDVALAVEECGGVPLGSRPPDRSEQTGAVMPHLVGTLCVGAAPS